MHCMIFTNFYACGRGSVFLLQGDKIPKGRGNFGVFFPIDSALYWSYSSMNFATKDQFRLSLLIYRKVRRNLIFCY